LILRRLVEGSGDLGVPAVQPQRTRRFSANVAEVGFETVAGKSGHQSLGKPADPRRCPPSLIDEC
jgi:hypothetical protein